mmetsp:Transcript_51024/g.83743  ORF Transcript_51024/g.83743 Transcript_51024/m.83743 type:complete len:370 (+) Transcript_51024:45-1154(+)
MGNSETTFHAQQSTSFDGSQPAAFIRPAVQQPGRLQGAGRSWTMLAFPISLAMSNGVSPFLFCTSSGALAASSSTTAALPSRTASWSGVSPSLSCTASDVTFIRSFTTSTRPPSAAKCKGVRPSFVVCASTGALALRSSWTTSAWPSLAAECSGVKPFQSFCCREPGTVRSRYRTAAALPFSAARRMSPWHPSASFSSSLEISRKSSLRLLFISSTARRTSQTADSQGAATVRLLRVWLTSKASAKAWAPSSEMQVSPKSMLFTGLPLFNSWATALAFWSSIGSSAGSTVTLVTTEFFSKASATTLKRTGASNGSLLLKAFASAFCVVRSKSSVLMSVRDWFVFKASTTALPIQVPLPGRGFRSSRLTI